MNIRPAKNEDGLRIRDLCAANGFGPDQLGGWEIDWSDIEPSWIVAEDDSGRVFSAIQLCAGKPIARLEMLVAEPDLPKRQKAEATVRLIDYGILMARMYGAQMVSGVIPDEMTSYQQVARRRGYFEGQHGSIWMKRVV